MIWYYLMTFFGNLVNAVFAFLPVVDELPFGMDDALTTAMGYFNYITTFFPFLQTLINVVLIYVSYKVLLIVLNVFKIYHHNHTT